MPISNKCPRCGHTAPVPDSFAGKKVTCPKCKERFEILEVFEGDIETVEPPFPIAQPAKPAYPPPVRRRRRRNDDESNDDSELVRESLPTHCRGCNKKLYNYLECNQCGGLFCSEICLNRHAKLTNHQIRKLEGCGKTAVFFLVALLGALTAIIAVIACFAPTISP